MKKHRALFVMIFSLISTSLLAQQTGVIDEILLEEKVSFGKTVYLALLAAGLIPEGASVDESLAVLKQKGWMVEPKSSEDAINLGEYSFLLMKAFEMPGGLLYSIFPGPRYACRELAHLNLIRGNSSPYRNLSGEEVLQMLGHILAWKEESS